MGRRLTAPPRLPQPVAGVIDRCFRVEPAERWPSLAEAAANLVLVHEEILQHSFPLAAPVSAALPKTNFTRHWPRRSTML
jgi:hypothetical protein